MLKGLASVNGRVREAELMDDPALDRAAHLQALRGLMRIYQASFTGAALWPWVRREAEAAGGSLRVLDLATGGGDLPIDLARRAARAGLAIEVAGCDMSRRALAVARLRARRAGCRVRFFRLNTATEPLPEGFDVITAGLFLHHLSDGEAVELLGRLAEAARRLVLVDDLRRSRWGLLLAHAAGRMLTRSPVVRVDGPRSVRAAFTGDELRDLAAVAGLTDTELVPHWPARNLLIWRRG